MRHPRTLLIGTVGALLTVALLPAVGDAQTSNGSPERVTIPGTAPSGPAAKALHSGAASAPAGRQVSFQVHLQLRDAAVAERLAMAVSTPGSPEYGRYLTPATFDARFAPTAAQAASVATFLRSYGISVGSATANRRFLDARGTVAQVSKAFGVRMFTYRLGGTRHLTDDRAASVPASIAPYVLTVTGLNETGQGKPGLAGRDEPTPTVAKSSAKRPHLRTPCSHFWGQKTATLPVAYGRTDFPTYICGYSPDQLQAGYGMQSAIVNGQDGSGVKVAIIDAYSLPTMEADANRFFHHYGERGFGKGQYSEKLPQSYRFQGPCDEPSWQTEEALDVESVHAMAPGASVTYVAGRSCSYRDLLTPLNKVVNGHLADIVSNSWGLFNEGSVPTSWLSAYHAVVVQAAAEGIGLYFCDLDNGDLSGNGGAEPVYPASDPMATGIGGTSLAVDTNGSYLFETGWGNTRAGVAFDGNGNPTGYSPPPPGTFYIGTGGGVSTIFRQPAYQKKLVPPSLSHLYGGKAMRVEPDISADADPYTGYRLGYTDPATGQWVRPTYGGTSLATPLVAAMVADASQGRKTPVGFFNPLLYDIVKHSTIHDVLPTRAPVGVAFTSQVSTSLCYTSCLITEDRDTSLVTTYGYDDVTGLGTPNGTGFLDAVHSAG